MKALSARPSAHLHDFVETPGAVDVACKPLVGCLHDEPVSTCTEHGRGDLRVGAALPETDAAAGVQAGPAPRSVAREARLASALLRSRDDEAVLRRARLLRG